jgi:hypothetical protein
MLKKELGEYLELLTFCFYLSKHIRRMGKTLLMFQVQLMSDKHHQNLKADEIR